MDIERRLVEAYRGKGKTLGLAESVTGGLIAERVTRVPGAGEVLVGSVVAYTDRVKRSLLGVDATLIGRFGAVSTEVAVEMAKGARSALGCDVAVSTTGFAGPHAPDGMPIGLVFVGIATAAGASSKELRLDGGRMAIREGAAAEALALALAAIEAR